MNGHNADLINILKASQPLLFQLDGFAELGEELEPFGKLHILDMN